jgi:hypothetical protein
MARVVRRDARPGARPDPVRQACAAERRLGRRAAL